MKGRAIIPLAVGLAIGVFAIKYFVSVVKKAKGASATEVVEVVCAGSDITGAAEIKDTMLEIKTMPKAWAPKLYIADRKEVVGRVAGQQIFTGMPIIQTLLAPKGTPPGLEIRIPPGHVAIAVQVDEFTGVAGWVNPGSRVDVIAVLSSRANSQDSISKVILQNVEVLAVGQDIGSKSDATASIPKSVTLAVKKADGPTLHLASAKGKIRLAMRNQADTELDKKVASTTDNQLLGDPEGSKEGAAKKVQGFLAGFMSKVPKPGENATDKEPRAREPQPPAPKPVAAAEKREWVQVYAGAQFKEELGFSRDGSSWRLVAYKDKKDLESDKGDSQDPGSVSARPAGPGPRSLFSRPLD